MVSRASADPAVRYLVGAVLAAVLLGDGLVLVGYTTQIHGRALEAGAPGSTPEAAAPVPLAPPLLPEGSPVPQGTQLPSAPGVDPPGQTGPAPLTPPNVETKPEAPRPPSSVTGRHWPDSLPDPGIVARQGSGRSPFAQRCASGEIAARWCRGFPGEHEHE